MYIEETIAFVKQALANAEAGHDWWHIYRVWKNAEYIGFLEGGDPQVIALAALLHDIADSKFHGGDEEVGPATAKQFLENLQVPAEIVNPVVKIIENISFKGGKTIRNFSSLELDIVQDADRLDAIGAIGIARAFNYGGFKNRPFYDPAIPPNLNKSKEEYKHNADPTINHFYEKLLLLKDRMNTATGKSLALQRHRFMEEFLQQFYREWEAGRPY